MRVCEWWIVNRDYPPGVNYKDGPFDQKWQATRFLNLFPSDHFVVKVYWTRKDPAEAGSDHSPVLGETGDSKDMAPSQTAIARS